MQPVDGTNATQPKHRRAIIRNRIAIPSMHAQDSTKSLVGNDESGNSKEKSVQILRRRTIREPETKNLRAFLRVDGTVSVAG